MERLRKAGLRPTRQRLALCELLFETEDRHLTAEILHSEAIAAGFSVSLATVYNTLHQLTHAGLLRQVVVDGERTYFDTNTSEHHHFFFEAENRLLDIPAGQVDVTGLPTTPAGTVVDHVEVIVRIKPA